MIHGMSLTFRRAQLADLGAEFAELAGDLAAAAQQLGRGAAQGGAVQIQRDAAHHAGDILLLEAGGSAVLAFGRAIVAGLDDAAVKMV